MSFYLFFFMYVQSADLQLNQRLTVEFIKLVTIKDDFYKATVSAIADNGDIIVFDQGNSKVNIYLKNGEKINQFGRRGYGPGEFSEFIKSIHCVGNNLYIMNFFDEKLSLFNKKGQLLNEWIKHGARSEIVMQQNLWLLYEKTSAVQWEILTEAGEIVNRTHQEPITEKNPYNFWNKPRFQMLPYNDLFVRFYYGPYKIEVVDKHLNVQKVFTRTVKNKEKVTKESFLVKNANGSINKEKSALLYQNYIKNNGAYTHEISYLCGLYKSYIVLLMESEKKHFMTLEFINPETNTYFQTEVKIDGMVSDKHHPIVIKNEKMLINLVNDIDGPFVDVFKLNEINRASF